MSREGQRVSESQVLVDNKCRVTKNICCQVIVEISKSMEKFMILGFVKHENGILDIFECPKSKGKCFLHYIHDKLKKKLLLIKCKEKLIY